MDYELDGFVGAQVSGVLTLIIGIGIASLVLVFVAVLGGSTYDLVEDDIDAISNTTVKDAVTSASQSGFEAMETTGDYLPLIALAIVITIVLGLVLMLGRNSMGQAGAL